MMELEVKENRQLKDGQHFGVIKSVEYRTEPFEYTDVYIESEGVTLKAGYPSYISENSKLGKLLMRFGAKLEVGSKLNPDTVLIGKSVTFMTNLEEVGGVAYSRVLPETVKPVGH